MLKRSSHRIGCALLASLCSLSASAAVTLDPVIAAYQKMTTAHLRSETTSTDEKGAVTASKTEFETLDRIHLTSTRVEIIMLPEGTWMRTGGNWNKPPIDMSGMIKNYRPLGEDALRSAKNLTDNGMTLFQGQPAHSWTYDVDIAVMGIHANSRITTYLSPTGTILGSESDGVALGHKTHNVQKVTFDNSIRVTAPN